MQKIEKKHAQDALHKRYIHSGQNSPVKGRHHVRSPLSDEEAIPGDATPNERARKSREVN